MVAFFKQCWIGEASLASAFWLVYVLFGAVFIIIVDLLVDFFVAGSFTLFYEHTRYVDMIITFALPWLLFGVACVWACGKNAPLLWSFLSKCLVLIPVIYAAFHFGRF